MREQISYPRDVLWKCTYCARCCGDLPGRGRQILLLSSEANEISRSAAIPVEAFADPMDDLEPYMLRMRKRDGRCVFLEENRCRVYPMRPLVCRFYPVWLRQEGPIYVFGVTEECPGIGQGKRLERGHYVSLLRLATARLGPR